MDKKKLGFLTTVVTVLLVATICVMFYAVLEMSGIGTADSYTYITAIAYSLTGLFAIYYILAGCKKEGANYFIWCTVAFAVCCALAYFRIDGMSPLDGIVNCLIFGALSVLSLAKDLGQKKSKTLAIVVVVLSVANLFDGRFSAEYPVLISNLVYSIDVLFMVIAKYYDKASRGSK